MNISFFLRIHFLNFSTVICFEFQSIILGFGIEVFCGELDGMTVKSGDQSGLSSVSAAH